MDPKEGEKLALGVEMKDVIEESARILENNALSLFKNLFLALFH